MSSISIEFIVLFSRQSVRLTCNFVVHASMGFIIVWCIRVPRVSMLQLLFVADFFI